MRTPCTLPLDPSLITMPTHLAHSQSEVVSFAAVIRVVARHATLLPTSGEERCVTSDDPNNGCEGD